MHIPSSSPEGDQKRIVDRTTPQSEQSKVIDVAALDLGGCFDIKGLRVRVATGGGEQWATVTAIGEVLLDDGRIIDVDTQEARVLEIDSAVAPLVYQLLAASDDMSYVAVRLKSGEEIPYATVENLGFIRIIPIPSQEALFVPAGDIESISQRSQLTEAATMATALQVLRKHNNHSHSRSFRYIDVPHGGGTVTCAAGTATRTSVYCMPIDSTIAPFELSYQEAAAAGGIRIGPMIAGEKQTERSVAPRVVLSTLQRRFRDAIDQLDQTAFPLDFAGGSLCIDNKGVYAEGGTLESPWFLYVSSDGRTMTESEEGKPERNPNPTRRLQPPPNTVTALSILRVLGKHGKPQSEGRED